MTVQVGISIADGDVRPCCMRLVESEFDMGNILRDSPETTFEGLSCSQHATRTSSGPESIRISRASMSTSSMASGTSTTALYESPNSPSGIWSREQVLPNVSW